MLFPVSGHGPGVTAGESFTELPLELDFHIRMNPVPGVTADTYSGYSEQLT